ncbi:MAG: M4 family metallopeptidase [Betaproteobacteria bacterium]|nr:M4 family metallopeptidase [Betaproteobacteria bacterium]
MARLKTLTSAAALLLLGTLTAHAGDGDNDRQTVLKARERLSALQMTGNDEQYDERSVLTDPDGAAHVRFNRRYKGLPVIGGDVVVHEGNGPQGRKLSRTLGGGLAVGTQASVSDVLARSYAQQLFKGNGAQVSTSQLAVYARGQHARLAYEVVVSGEQADGTPSEMHFILDAHTLNPLDQWDTVMTADAVGSGKSLTEGTVQLHTNSITGGYELRDLTRGSHYTLNLKNRTSGGSIFTDADNVWGNFATSDTATAAVDATYGQNKTWDYYKAVHGRNGIANDGRGAYSRVHYSRNYVNAFWSDSCFCMTYGDGDGVTYLPLVALDVAGHEMTHGVTARSAGLIYSGESGGLNEATSDIMGTMVEYYANNANSVPNYLIGERIYKASYTQAYPTKALRYMFKPSLDGASPDCYSSSLGSLDVHYSSGVANHFYYLLAEGATVPTGFSLTKAQLVCNGNTALTGIGRDAAAKIWYRALTVYMTSNTNYAGARSATLQAAADLYGNGSAQYAAVAAAWSAVSVN